MEKTDSPQQAITHKADRSEAVPMTIAKDVTQSINDTAKAITKVTAIQTALTGLQNDCTAALSDLQVVAADLVDIQNDIMPVPVSPPPPPVSPPPPPVSPPPPPPVTSSGPLDTSTFLYKYGLQAVTPTYSATLPAVGVPWVCPQTGAPVMRATDWTKMPGAPKDLSGVCSDYSRYPIISKDKTLVYINGVGGNEASWLLSLTDLSCNGPIKSFGGAGLGENNLIRWDNSGNRNHVFYYVIGTALYEKDLDAGTDTLIRDFAKDFPGIQQITNGVEGDVSLDGTIFAFMGQVYTGGYWTSPHIFGYNRATNSITGVYPNPITNPETSSPNMVDPVPDGSGIVIDWGVKQGSAADQDGAHYYPLNFDVSKAVKVGHGEEHSGWAMNEAGAWGLVSQDNSTDNFIWCSMTGGYNGADMIVLGNLKQFGYKEDGNFHFGKVTVPGWIPIFTDHTADAQPGDNQILMMPIAPNATPLYVSQSYNISDSAHYYSQFFPSITLDGILIAGGSNYGQKAGAHQDVYLYGLPADWATHKGT